MNFWNNFAAKHPAASRLRQLEREKTAPER